MGSFVCDGGGAVLAGGACWNVDVEGWGDRRPDADDDEPVAFDTSTFCISRLRFLLMCA